MDIVSPGLILEMLVIFLLALTAGYCFVLNRRLKNLRDSQGELRQIIGELNQATIRAESAIEGLKVTTHEADEKLRDNLEKAKTLTAHFGALTRSHQTERENVMPLRKAG